MSTATDDELKEYLVIIPDFPGKLKNRIGTKAAHIEGAIPMINGGQLPYFGVTLAKHAAEGEQPEINGSLMVIKARSESSIQEFLEKDAYTQAGVWDIKNAKVFPFKAG